MQATLLIERKKSFIGCARQLKVLLDQKEIGYVSNGQTGSFSIDPRPHFVSVEIGSASCRPISIQPAGGESVKLKAVLKMGWWATSDFQLTREDGTGADGTSPPAKHHGTILLIFGFLGFIVGILGLAALIQGIIDLKKMKRGEMDPSGRGLTLAASIIGGAGFIFALSTRIIACSNS